MLYPLFFEPVYKNIIWGGRNLERVFNRNLPEGDVAESWEVCSHKNGTSVVKNGPLKGKRLDELAAIYKRELLGTKCETMDRFPLLVKIIDANDKLSVQVHPNNEYALKAHGDLGKTEMWYILDAKEGAQLIYGTAQGISREDFKASIRNGTLEKYLNYVPVKKGDVAFIPAGTVHAIMDGLLIAEIQQNSDTTYRLYDWNRVDPKGNSRELHIDRAMDVIDFDFKGNVANPPEAIEKGFTISRLADCEFFKVDKITVKEFYEDKTDGSSLITYTSVEGNGCLVHNEISYGIPSGTSFLLPASAGSYTITGSVTLLKSYI